MHLGMGHSILTKAALLTAASTPTPWSQGCLCASFTPKSINYFLLSPLFLSILNLMINLLNYIHTNIFNSLVLPTFPSDLVRKNLIFGQCYNSFLFLHLNFYQLLGKKILSILNTVATKYLCPSALARPKN